MSLFGSFADVLAKFSPRRPHHHRRPSFAQHSDTPPSRPHSQSPSLKTLPQIEKERNQFSLGSDKDDNLEGLRERPLVNATPELNVQSDDTPLSLVGRGKLRSPTSQLDIDLTVRPGHSPQMLSGEQKRIEIDRQDEARLLGVKNVNDDQATKIVPGALFQKSKRNPGSSAAFKPTDTLSQHTRQNGPVRAQGKSKQPKPHDSKVLQRLDDASDDLENSSRPRKRRRQEDPGSSNNTRHDSTSDQLSRISPGSSQYSSSKSKSNGWTSRHPEYRDVEENIRVVGSPRRARYRRFSEDSQDERFTAQATQQRRSLIPDYSSPESHRRVHPRLETLPVAVPSGKDTLKQVLSSPVQTSRPRWISSSRESPDELQGEATTQPIPKNLGDKPKQNRHSQQVRGALVSPSRKRSPADIQPTEFTESPRQGPKRTRHNPKVSSGFELEVTSFRFGSIGKTVTASEFAVVDLREDSLEVGEDIAGPRNRTSILLRNVVVAIRGREPSTKIRLKLAKKNGAPGNLVDIELSTAASKTRLVRTLQDKEIKIQDKDGSFMDKAFANHERELIEHGHSPTRPFLNFMEEGELAPETNPILETALQPTMRQKISSALQESAGESSKNTRTTQDTAEHSNDADSSRVETQSDKIQESDNGIKPHVKTCRGPTSTERETRARTRQTTRESDRSRNRNEISPSRLHLWSSERDIAREKWQKPLVYPQAGKKRAEVNEEDRDRLREGEFLNDNLIGLYMRFLQDHLERTNPKAAKQVYFFNSYFFATLTNTPKGDRGINYAGVEKWTRSVDLFSYDYIVVPINQNAHWYVAIICNLPSLCSETADRVQSSLTVDQEPRKEPEGEVFQIPESPEPEPCPTSPALGVNTEASQKRALESPDCHEARQSLACMSLDRENALDKTEKQSGSADEWPDREENQASPSAKFSPVDPPETLGEPTASSQTARKSKKTRASHNSDPDQTKIVTFDSLGHSRSPTIRHLKEYILQEAVSKRGIDVEMADIKGMCARQIPLQPNFSDCGLYLLAYLEKFAQDPDLFTQKLLRREMNEHTDWPPLGSGLLRYRLRNFLDELYEEQTRLKTTKYQSSIMADQQPVSFLLGPPLPSQDTEDPAQVTPALTEKGQPVEPPKATRASKKSAEKESLSHETPEPHDEEATDVPQLVPTGLVDVSGNAKASPESKSTGADPTKPNGPIETEVTEASDSQELPLDFAYSGSSLAEKKETKKAEDLTATRKSERKKITPSNESEAVTATKFRPEKPPKAPKAPKVEVQVRETPPPNDEPVRKSPRGKRRT